jgi:DNA mismatch repair protein MutS2
VSRPSQELLEFDRLKNIVSGFTTCLPGRRAIEALAPIEDRAWLDAQFVLIREGVEYLRGGSELGFGSLADPEIWLGQLAIPNAELTAGALLDAVTLTESIAAVRATFKADSAKAPKLAERAAAVPDLGALSTAIRRAILPNGEISDDASPQLRRIRGGLVQARENIQHALRIFCVLAWRAGRRGLRYAAQRPLCDSGAGVGPARGSRRCPWASATGQTVFVEPLEAIDLNNRLVQLAGRRGRGDFAHSSGTYRALARQSRAPLETAAAEIAHLDSLFARGVCT